MVTWWTKERSPGGGQGTKDTSTAGQNVFFLFSPAFFTFSTQSSLFRQTVVFSPDPLSFSPDPSLFRHNFSPFLNVHIAARLAEASEHIPKKCSRGGEVGCGPTVGRGEGGE
jgi:hypothetical protein